MRSIDERRQATADAAARVAVIVLAIVALTWALVQWGPRTLLGAYEPVPLRSTFVPSPPSDAEPMPTFTGPLATDYEAAWNNSVSHEVRAMLADERIDSNEVTAIYQAFRICLAEQGITFTGYRNGGYSFDPHWLTSENMQVRLDACARRTGERDLMRLYQEEHRDLDAEADAARHPNDMMAKCLVRNGAVADTYTAEQYGADYPTRSFPFIADDGRAMYDNCEADWFYDRNAGLGEVP